MAYENYTVRQFREAYFNKDYSVMDKEKFEIVYSEYMDTSGLFYSEDFEKQGLIYSLSGKLNYVSMFIRIQRDFIAMFGMPFVRDFNQLKKRGYRLKWNNDLADFENQLKKIEQREKSTDSFLQGKIKELNDARKKREENQPEETEEKSEEELKKARNSFIKMCNSLNKIGYKIDLDKTTVEELALMIKQQFEEQDALRDKNGR